jgi:hypothetical protein
MAGDTGQGVMHLTILGRIRCMMGRHDRSRSKARPRDDNTYTSVCRHCGVAMERDQKRNWRVIG